MARIDKGNDLSSPVLQPGWTIQQDGYGLFTGRCMFKMDKSYAVNVADFERGLAHPVSPFNTYMFSNTSSVSYDRNGIANITIDYVGINNTAEGASTDTTSPNVSGAVSTSSEGIETHPNFFVATIEDEVIAGVGTGTATAPIYEASSFKAKTSDAATLYKGENGAHFTQKSGGQFVGFLDPAFPLYYGRKSYLSPQTGFSGVIYTTDSDVVIDMKDAVGRSSSTNDWGGNLPQLLPAYLGGTFLSNPVAGGVALPQLLLASVNFEDFGLSVKKINYTIRYNVEGWVTAVHPIL